MILTVINKKFKLLYQNAGKNRKDFYIINNTWKALNALIAESEVFEAALESIPEFEKFDF